MNDPPKIFDKNKITKNHVRAALTKNSRVKKFFEFLSTMLTERISSLNINFDQILEIGTRSCQNKNAPHYKFFKSLYQTSTSITVAKNFSKSVVCSLDIIPFKDSTFDLRYSFLSLHTVDDLPGTLLQIKNILKPGGVFICAIPGGKTLSDCFPKARSYFVL